MDEIRKIVREILMEMWQHMTSSEAIDNFGRASSSKPMIPYNQRMNDYEQVSLQKGYIDHAKESEGFEFDGASSANGKEIYTFDTHEEEEERNADFIVDVEFSEIDEIPEAWEIKVKTATGEDGILKNRSRISKVFLTISSILEDFVENYDPSAIVFQSIETEDATQKNVNNLFVKYLENKVPLGYIFSEKNGNAIMNKKNFHTSFNKLNDLMSPPSNATGRVNPDFSGY